MLVLLEKGADINAKCDYGYTALYRASGHGNDGNDGMVRLLLEKGADIGATDHVGRTALQHGSVHGGKVVLWLLLAGVRTLVQKIAMDMRH